MDWLEIGSFVLVASLLVMSPGPNGALIAKTVPTSGRRAGFANITGFVAAFHVHGAFSILGISVILLQSATAFAVIKYLGAAYLCWIGVKALLAAWRTIDHAPSTTEPARKQTTLVAAFAEGFLTNALNPKVSMFYLAAFPQFMSMGDASAGSAFLLVFLHSMINALWFGVMVLMLAKLSRMARNQRFQRWLKGVTGVVFISFGVRLANARPGF